MSSEKLLENKAFMGSLFSSKKTFMSVIHSELIFVYGVKVEVQFPSFTCGYPFVPSSFVEETIYFSIRCCCCCCSVP